MRGSGTLSSCLACLPWCCGRPVVFGDAGVYGMAAWFQRPPTQYPRAYRNRGELQRLTRRRLIWRPLMLDYACISLRLVVRKVFAIGWKRRRSDLVGLYNPKSKKRVKQIAEAAAIFQRYRPATTPVGIATAVGRREEKIVVSDLGHFLEMEIDMRSVVIVGNSSSQNLNGWFITPRGYRI